MPSGAARLPFWQAAVPWASVRRGGGPASAQGSKALRRSAVVTLTDLAAGLYIASGQPAGQDLPQRPTPTCTLTDGARRLPPPPRDGTPRAPDALLHGQVLDDRYEVDRRLGAGGMSEVYLARQLPMGRACALKVLAPARADDQEAISRFEREAALASRMAHPNLCHIYDAGRTPTGLPYLAMEWLDGLSLAELLEAGALPPDRVARIVAGCAAGLAAAHDAGVIHRDLKPGNVMLVQRDGVETPVVMDFGIALALGEAGLTRDGLMVGTPEVMSPEQIAGDPVDARNDQYQLALLACRMLTGALPFPAESSQASMVRRLTDRPTPLAALRPSLQVGTEVQRAIDRALARRPADRFPDIRSFATALGAALMAGPDGATEVLDRPPLPMREPSAPPEIASADGSRRRGGWWAAGLLLVVAVGAYFATLPPADDPDPGPLAPVPVPPVPAPSPVPVPISPATPGSRTSIPALPADSLVFSADSAVRRRAREQAERVYRSGSATDSVRATAAFFVAEIVRREGLYATARQWLESCLALQPERTMCRRLLDTLP